MLSLIVDRRRGTVLIGTGLVVVSAGLYALYGPRALAGPLAVAFIYLAMKLGAGSLAQLSARTRLSLRWKVTGAISLMLVILLGVSLVALAASNYIHTEVHALQELRGSAPIPAIARTIREAQGPEGELLRQMQLRLATIPAAFDRLENRQHLILTWIPAAIFGGGLVAVVLGTALSSSLIWSIRQMSEGTRRIASGDFSQPVDVPNRDELGEPGHRPQQCGPRSGAASRGPSRGGESSVPPAANSAGYFGAGGGTEADLQGASRWPRALASGPGEPPQRL